MYAFPSVISIQKTSLWPLHYISPSDQRNRRRWWTSLLQMCPKQWSGLCVSKPTWNFHNHWSFITI